MYLKEYLTTPPIIEKKIMPEKIKITFLYFLFIKKKLLYIFYYLSLFVDDQKNY